MPNLLPKLPKKLKKRNCKHRLLLLIGRDRLRRLRLSREDSRLLLQPLLKPRRLNSKLKDRDKKLDMMQL